MKTRSDVLVGTLTLCPPLAMPLHFLSGEHSLAESQLEVLSGRETVQGPVSANSWWSSSFARQILGQWDLGALMLWDESCPRRRSLLQDFLSLTSGLPPTIFLLHQDRDPDISPGPDLPRSDGGDRERRDYKILKQTSVLLGQKFKYTTGVFGLGGPNQGLGSHDLEASCPRKVG